MKKTSFTFQDIEFANSIERLDFETRSRTSIIANLIKNNKDDDSLLDSQLFMNYYHKLEKTKIEYDIYLKIFNDMYLLPIVKQLTNKDHPNFYWTIDFQTREVELEYED